MAEAGGLMVYYTDRRQYQLPLAMLIAFSGEQSPPTLIAESPIVRLEEGSTVKLAELYRHHHRYDSRSGTATKGHAWMETRSGPRNQNDRHGIREPALRRR
jgi:hypothetical protein